MALQPGWQQVATLYVCPRGGIKHGHGDGPSDCEEHDEPLERVPVKFVPAEEAALFAVNRAHEDYLRAEKAERELKALRDEIEAEQEDDD